MNDATVTLSVKKWFFSTDLVKQLIDNKTRSQLSRWGRYARGVAIKLPKRRGRKSRPGETPTKWQPKRRDQATRPRNRVAASLDMVLYAFDPPWSVVFGPVGLPGHSPTVPNKLQFGTNQRTKNHRRRRRRMGGTGEIQTQGKRSKTTRQIIGSRKPGKPWVTFVRLRTAKQVARANSINEDLYGPMVLGAIKPRPWINLAVEAASKKFGDVFAGSVLQ
jgi:hypothetical protein